MEKEASTSLEAKEAVAAALAVSLEQLNCSETAAPKKYVYRSVEIKLESGATAVRASQLDCAINVEAADGERVVQVLLQGTIATEMGPTLVRREKEK